MQKDKKRIARRVVQVIISVVVAVLIVGVLYYVTQGRDLPILNPSGTIADQQRTLIYITVGLGFFVVIPVFILLFSIAWRYRDGGKASRYQPDAKEDMRLEALWWGIPILIIIALSIITWISTHNLDPFKPLESTKNPVKVQVVSLEWRWLFIYPELGTATINYMNIPENTPIDLSLTSDAPMNTFWVPALAGQVYTMNGMTMKLHLSADEVGTYDGMTSNISGEGYSKMRFKVHSMTEHDFTAWAEKSAQSSNMLTRESYSEIAKQSLDNSEKTYMLMDTGLYDAIINKYMGHENMKTEESHDTHTMNMSGMEH